MSVRVVIYSDIENVIFICDVLNVWPDKRYSMTICKVFS